MSLSKSGSKKITVVPVVLIFLLMVSSSAFSQQRDTEENSRDMQVKYLDGDNDALLFNLKYANDSGNDFKLMVLNETGEVLFQNNYSGKNFRKKIKLARLTDTDRVTFLIRSARENIQLSYKVKVKRKVADESAITSMD